MENEYVICTECGKKILKSESKKHKYNDEYDYCKDCYTFWFE